MRCPPLAAAANVACKPAAGGRWVVSGFVNNVFDDVGVLQVLADGEQEFFAHSAGTTVPRLYGLEVTYSLGNL